MFKFYRAGSISEALKLVEQFGERFTFYAGGTDLLPAIRVKTIQPENIIYLGSIPELKVLEEEKEFIRIGALVTHAMLASSSLIKTQIPTLAEACSLVGSPQTRNLGTIGGNLCWASPAADTAPVLIVHDAQVRLISKRGERKLPVRNFFMGPNQTAAQPDELLAEILVPKPQGKWAGTFIKIGRRKALTISVVSCAVLLMEGGSRANIAMGSVAPIPLRAQNAEDTWHQAWEIDNPEMARLTGRTAGSEAQPITDSRAPAWYRREITGIVVERALNQCLLAIKS